jgi:purine-nucleoside phosphorylase
MVSDIDATSAKNIIKLADLIPPHLLKPCIGIVCGSGLGMLAENIAERVIVPYSALEGFGESTGALTTTSNDKAQVKAWTTRGRGYLS